MVLQVEALDKVNGQSATAQISVESKSGTVSTTTGTAVTQPVTGPGVTITKPPSTGTTTAAPTKSIVPNTGSTTTRSPALSSTTLPALGSGHTEKPGATSSTVTIATTRVTSPGPSTTTKSPGSALPETGTTSWRTTGSPSTNRPSTKPSQPPGLVTTPGQAGPSSSSLPVTLTNSVILPGPNLIHTAQDMAALGATLAVLLVISLILNGLFAYKIYKKRVKKYNSIYQDNYGSGYYGKKEGLQFINEGYQDEEKSKPKEDEKQQKTSNPSEKEPETLIQQQAVPTTSLPSQVLDVGSNPTETSSQKEEDSDGEKEVKSILTKERKMEEGYKAVWFKEDIEPDAKDDVVVINSEPEGDEDHHDNNDYVDEDDSADDLAVRFKEYEDHPLQKDDVTSFGDPEDNSINSFSPNIMTEELTYKNLEPSSTPEDMVSAQLHDSNPII
nr:PREDICTED: cadherin-related family member 5 isoform X3 [Latimeria chalumnae]|eukprot:XP_014343493.1 PREDICTED: cadherin-related family member 5 isoform X3 [Latimeria chalumnae]